MSELEPTSTAGEAGLYSLSARLFKNIESYPGQLMMTPSLMSAQREGKIARRDAVKGARSVERTSAPIMGGLDRSADMVVGGRILVRPTPDWDLLGIKDWTTKKPFAQACARAFHSWGYNDRLLCDAEGHGDFSAMMWLAFRHAKGPDGETAGIVHFEEERRKEYATPWGTFVTVLDPQRVETPPDQVGRDDVYQGLRLDRHGRRIGMWFTKGHPADGWNGVEPQHEYVPRETYWGRAVSWHWFTKRRGGQQRGLTNLVTIIRRSNMLDQFDDAQLGSALIAAVLQTYIKTTASAETMAEQLAPGKDGLSVTDMKLDYYSKAKIRSGAHRIPLLAPNDDIVMASVARAIADPTAFRTGFMREFGLALGIGQGQISNSFADYNYASMRADLMEVFRGVHRERHQFMKTVGSPIYAAVIEEAIAIGAVELPPGAPPFQENRAAYTACEWTGPGMGSIDPLKEANAKKVLLEIKDKSHQQLAAADGDDYLETFDQIEQERIEAEERGFSLDATPAATETVMPSDDPENAPSSSSKKPKGVPGDGDGDGIADEKNQGA